MCPSAYELIEFLLRENPRKRRAAFHLARVLTVIPQEGQQFGKGLRRSLCPLNPLTPQDQRPDIPQPSHFDPAGDVLERNVQKLRLALDLVRGEEPPLVDDRVQPDLILNPPESR